MKRLLRIKDIRLVPFQTGGKMIISKMSSTNFANYTKVFRQRKTKIRAISVIR